MRTSTLLAAAVLSTAISILAAPALAAPVPLTPARLAATQRVLDDRLATAPAGVTSSYVDPASHRVVVTVLAGDSVARRAVERAGAGLAGMTVVTVQDRPRLLYDVVGGQTTYTTASAARCSVGFSARSSIGAVPYVITAGHCTKLGGTWSGYNRTTLGPVSASSFPDNDFGTIRVTNTASWTLTSKVQNTSSVLGSTPAALGAAVCRAGSSTSYRCGTIRAKEVTVRYPEGTVRGLTMTTACAEPGDSGGPFVAGRQAQGVTSGGSGGCADGGMTYFQPIGEILSYYGLTLVTG